MDATENNWEAAFSLSETARQQVLCSSRLRHRPSPMDPPIDDNAYSTTRVDSCIRSQAAVSQQNPLTQTNHRPQSPASPRKRTHTSSKPHDDGHTSDDAVPPCSQSKQPNNPSSKTTRRCSKNCDDTAKSDVSRLLPQKMLLAKIPCSAESHSEDDIVTCYHQPRRKRTKVQMETIIDTVFTNDELTAARLEVEFFQCDALELAPKLLGKFLRRDEVVLQITEVEAYRPNDSACHGQVGVTARTAPLFGPGGHAYVYLCYGMHNMLNVVADVKGVGAAVLIRACAPVAGMQTIQSRRGISSNKPILLTGPGKIGQALGLTTDWSSHPLYTAGGLEVLDGPPPEKILVGPRVGIEYANPEDVAALWRFAISGTPWISAPRNTLRPA
eukprot:c22912_g1_i2 orf=97-1251(+)